MKQFGGVASAVSVSNSADVALTLVYQGNLVAVFDGHPTIDLALTRPMKWDSVECFGPSSEGCHMAWIGNAP